MYITTIPIMKKKDLLYQNEEFQIFKGRNDREIVIDCSEGKFKCSQVYDADLNNDGIEIFEVIGSHKKYISTIWGYSFPDFDSLDIDFIDEDDEEFELYKGLKEEALRRIINFVDGITKRFFYLFKT